MRESAPVERSTHAASAPLSWRARGAKVLLHVMRRRRIYASISGLMAGIASARRAGPAQPPAGLRASVDLRKEQVGRCEVYTLRPRAPSADGKVVLYLHGGAYCRPITRQHWSFLQWLVADQGFTVAVPLYPLAPESECIATLQAVRDVHALVAERHGTVHAFVGDSAGAGLCLALCQDLRDRDAALPNRLVLITPWVDVTLTHPDIPATLPRDPMLAIDGVREAGRLYAGRLDVDHPLVSPIRADLRGLPPMQVLAGTDDILHHDAVAFAGKAREAGCGVELHVEGGMIHAWPLLPMPEATRSRRAIGSYLRR